MKTGIHALKPNPGIFVLRCLAWLVLASGLAATVCAQIISTPYTFTTIAGTARFDTNGMAIGGSADGVGTNAQFNVPGAITADNAGNLYVVDLGNGEIRRLAAMKGPEGLVTNWAVTTLAGHSRFATNANGVYPIGGYADGIGTNALFDSPEGLAVDRQGTIYVADSGNNVIRRITPAWDGLQTNWIVSTLLGSAGQPTGDYGANYYADGTNEAARFWHPSAIAVGNDGALYVADGLNDTIRMALPILSSDGTSTNWVVTTIAGTPGDPEFLGVPLFFADGVGPAARFQYPHALAMDHAGILYVADQYNNAIRKILGQDTNWIVTTLAGQYIPGDSQNYKDGFGLSARFHRPGGITVDAAGIVYVADTGNDLVRRVTPDGVTSTLAGQPQLAGSADGTGPFVLFDQPASIAIGMDGKVYLADSGNFVIRQGWPSIEPPIFAIQPESRVVSATYGTTFSASIVSTPPWSYQWRKNGDNIQGATNAQYTLSILGSADAGAYTVAVSNAFGLVTSSNAVLTVLDTAYTFITMAGSTNGGFKDGTGPDAQFQTPGDVAIDSVGTLFVADVDNSLIRKLTPAGVVTTFAGLPPGPSFYAPEGLDIDASGSLLVGDTSNQTIRQVSPSGEITTLAGLQLRPGSADGTNSAARFDWPASVSVDETGTLYVADSFNSTIRKITRQGQDSIVSTLAGTPHILGSADGAGTNALFRQATGVAARGGRVYVGDAGNHAIRMISSEGLVTTFAGSPQTPGNLDGLATFARFGEPGSVTLDSFGNLFVSDWGNATIRKIFQTGTNWMVATIAGLTGNPGYADGCGSSVRFGSPAGLRVDVLGNVYVADAANNVIRKGWVAGTPPILTLGNATLSDAGMRFDVTIQTGLAETFTLLQSDQLGGGWTTNAVGILTTNVPHLSYSFTVPIGVSTRFFKVQSP